MAIPLEQIKEVPGSSGLVFQCQVHFPSRRHPKDLLVYHINNDWRAIPRACPHQGYDLIGCNPSPEGLILCPLHSLPINLFGDESYSVQFEKSLLEDGMLIEKN